MILVLFRIAMDDNVICIKQMSVIALPNGSVLVESLSRLSRLPNALFSEPLLGAGRCFEAAWAY